MSIWQLVTCDALSIHDAHFFEKHPMHVPLYPEPRFHLVSILPSEEIQIGEFSLSHDEGIQTLLKTTHLPCVSDLPAVIVKHACPRRCLVFTSNYNSLFLSWLRPIQASVTPLFQSTRQSSFVTDAATAIHYTKALSSQKINKEVVDSTHIKWYVWWSIILDMMIW